MKKLILLTLLTLLVSAHKTKAWCVLCYHPRHSVTESYTSMTYNKNRYMLYNIDLPDYKTELKYGDICNFCSGIEIDERIMAHYFYQITDNGNLYDVTEDKWREAFNNSDEV